MELVFGGSFDPIHLGHFNVIENLTKRFPDLPIRIIPCSIPALKSRTSASFEQRVEMINLSLKPFAQIRFDAEINIDQRENLREGKSYTVDTLESLSKEFPERRFVLVVGADTLKSMNQWHRWKKLSELCHLLVVNRPNYKIDNLKELAKSLGFSAVKGVDELMVNDNGCYSCLNIEEVDTSSTEIRKNFTNGLSNDKFISNDVINYINNNLIYKQEL